MQAIYAVHDYDHYTRDMGGIDLSDVYHDVVTVLRMDTKWATETLDFWNKYEFWFVLIVKANILI